MIYTSFWPKDTTVRIMVLTLQRSIAQKRRHLGIHSDWVFWSLFGTIKENINIKNECMILGPFPGVKLADSDVTSFAFSNRSVKVHIESN